MNEPQPEVDVALNHKFAILAVPDCRAGCAPSRLVQLQGGYAVSQGLPTSTLETWRDNLGFFHINELAETRLFLWSVRASGSPDILDQENEALSRDCYQLYLGLLIAVPYFSNGRLTALTGANADGVARVRSLATYARTYYTRGAPPARLTMSRLRLAASLASAIKSHDRCSNDRMVRALRSFRVASESHELDFRLHQFVRCAEAFAHPPFGKSAKHFAARLSRLCVGRSKACLQELYKIRSGIEHQHGPFDRMPKGSTPARHLRLMRRCVEAETVARFLLAVYLSNPILWPHFTSRHSIDAFWSLPTRKLRRLWATRLGLEDAMRAFQTDDAAAAIAGD